MACHHPEKIVKKKPRKSQSHRFTIFYVIIYLTGHIFKLLNYRNYKTLTTLQGMAIMYHHANK